MKTENNWLNFYKKVDKTFLLLIYIFLMVPILMWLWFWFKVYVAIPCMLAAIYGLVIFYKSIQTRTLEEYKKILEIVKGF